MTARGRFRFRVSLHPSLKRGHGAQHFAHAGPSGSVADIDGFRLAVGECGAGTVGPDNPELAVQTAGADRCAAATP